MSVRVSSPQVSAAAAASTSTKAGSTERVPCADTRSISASVPKASIEAGMFMNSEVPTKVSSRPRYRDCVPLVTISDGGGGREPVLGAQERAGREGHRSLAPRGAFAFGYGASAFGRPGGEGWNTFAFGYGMSAFGRPCGDRWNTFAFGYGASAFGRPGGDGWNTFAFGCGMSAFGRPGGAHAAAPAAGPVPSAVVSCVVSCVVRSVVSSARLAP